MKSLRKYAKAKIYNKYNCIHSIGINVSNWSLSSDYHKVIVIYNRITSTSRLREPEKLMLSTVSIDQKRWCVTLYRKANIIFNIRKNTTTPPAIHMFRRSQ